MFEPTTFTVHLEQKQGYQFAASFEQPAVPDILLDEPGPLSAGEGPNASQVLAVAVGNCLTASLLFCLHKCQQEPATLQAEVTTRLAPNAQGHQRIAGIDVVIRLQETAGQVAQFGPCMQQFENYCVVTDSVRRGVPVHVKVVDGAGNDVYAADT